MIFFLSFFFWPLTPCRGWSPPFFIQYDTIIYLHYSIFSRYEYSHYLIQLIIPMVINNTTTWIFILTYIIIIIIIIIIITVILSSFPAVGCQHQSISCHLHALIHAGVADPQATIWSFLPHSAPSQTYTSSNHAFFLPSCMQYFSHHHHHHHTHCYLHVGYVCMLPVRCCQACRTYEGLLPPITIM